MTNGIGAGRSLKKMPGNRKTVIAESDFGVFFSARKSILCESWGRNDLFWYKKPSKSERSWIECRVTLITLETTGPNFDDFYIKIDRFDLSFLAVTK